MAPCAASGSSISGAATGAFATQVRDRGAASYLGVDGSQAMIEIAVRDHGTDRARFTVGDIEDLSVEAEAFDVVTSRMALHHVEHLGPVLAAVHRSLVPGGRLVCSVVHPVITCHDRPSTGRRTSWTVDNYFVAGGRTRPWFGGTVTWYHRTVEQHVTALAENGFRLASLRECEPSAALLADDQEELRRRRRVPLMLVLAATRAET